MSINPSQAQRLRLVRQHQAAVQAQAQAQAQADRREAAQRAPVNGQYGAYGFRTLPQPSAAQAKPARLPLRTSTEAPEFRLPERDTAEDLAGLMELLLAQRHDDGTVDADGERRGGHGGDRGASHDERREPDSRGHGDDTPGDERGRERQPSGDSHAGAGGTGSGDTGAGGGGGSGSGSGSSAGGGNGNSNGNGNGNSNGNGNGSRNGNGHGGRPGSRPGALGADRGRAVAGLPGRRASADRRRDWVPLPRDPLRDLTPLLAPFLRLQRPVPGADDGAHALASALITFGAATAPPDRPGVGALRLAAMAAYIDAQAAAGAPGAFSTLSRVKAVLMDHVTTARAAAASPAGARARNRWALLPLELLVCDKPRTGGQRQLAVERLRAAHGFLGRFKNPATASKGQP
jgi:hypothetical protein